MNNVVMKRMFRFWNRISIRILFIFVLITPFLVDSLPQREGKQRGNQDSCNVDADCQKNGQTNRCCSQFYFCGTGPDYCAEGCTFPDVEFVGGDLSKAQGGGGVKKRYDDQCIIACEKNPKCQFYTYDYDAQLCYLKKSLGERRDSAEKGRVLSGGLDESKCEPEEECEPPYEKVNLQCVLVPEEGAADGNGTNKQGKGGRNNFAKTVETCHVFEGSLPTYLLSNAQLNPTGIPPKEFPNTLLQGNLAPDLFGIGNRGKRSADYTQDEPLEIEECFIDPGEIEIKYERKLVSNRLRDYDSQSCYGDVILTGISEDLKKDASNNRSEKLERPRQLFPSFQDEPILKAFPNLNSRPVSDRWAWLNYPKNDDGLCVATLPGFAGKYRLFPCDTELYMVCERRNPNYPRPSPPIIKKIPTRRAGTENIPQNSFSGSNQSPSFGFGAGSTISQGGNSGVSFPSVSSNTLPRPAAPQGTYPVNTGSYAPVTPVRNDYVPRTIKKNPFIVLHDKIAEAAARKRLLKQLNRLGVY